MPARVKATVEQFRADYDNTVATYRQTVLTAFQQVEDNLSTVRILAQQIEQQETAVRSSERYLSLATERYKSLSAAASDACKARRREVDPRRAARRRRGRSARAGRALSG